MKKRNWSRLLQYAKGICWYRFRFAGFGKHTLLVKPMQIDYPHTLSLGNDVAISHYAWLMGSASLPGPTLTIGDHTKIGHFFHCSASRRVVIEDHVLIADKVFISDCTHRYEDVAVPVNLQGVEPLADVVIGAGSWIGENVCVLGASIGKHCVIGANAVVTKSIPDYCIAVGAPAKVVKWYNADEQQWRRVYGPSGGMEVRHGEAECDDNAH